jgi:hypothetical protein
MPLSDRPIPGIGHKQRVGRGLIEVIHQGPPRRRDPVPLRCPLLLGAALPAAVYKSVIARHCAPSTPQHSSSIRLPCASRHRRSPIMVTSDIRTVRMPVALIANSDAS